MSRNYPSSALRHGQVHKTTNSVDRQAVRWQISYEANICFDIGIIVVKLMIAVSKIEVVAIAKCIIFCSLMSSQAARQKCSELLTANLVMDGQNLSEVEV